MGHKSHEPWAHAIKTKQTVRGNKSIIIMQCKTQKSKIIALDS